MISWHRSDTDNTRVLELCYLAENDHRPASKNLNPRNFSDNPHTLMYKLVCDKRFDTGGYGIYSLEDKIIAGSGYHQSEWHPDIWIWGNRSYTIPGYQSNYVQGELWHTQMDLVREQGGKILMVPFNKYNLKLRDQGVRLNDPDRWKNSFYLDGDWYREPGKRITPVKPVDHSMLIYNTEQWIFYHILDSEWEKEFLEICGRHRYDH